MSSFVHHAALISATTLLSRLLGFGRDATMAWLLGAGPAADALTAALRLPWAARRLLGDGALSMSLTAACAAEANPYALALAVARRLVPYLLAATLLLVLAAPWLGDLLAPGASDSVREQLPPLLRLCLPYMPLAVISACAMAGLHAARRFVISGVMPVVFNGVVIGFALAAFPLRESPSTAALLVAAGVLVGGMAQWLPGLAVMRTATSGAVVAPHRVEQVLRRLPAGLLGAGMAQGAFVLAGIMASWLPHGHMAALFYAERLLEFPMGVLGAALGMAAVPEIHRNRELAAPLLEWTLTLHMAAAAGLMAVAEPLAATVLGHGAFDAVAVRQTASALQAYAWGLPAYALSRPLLALSSHAALHAEAHGEGHSMPSPVMSPTFAPTAWGIGICLLIGGLLTMGLIPSLTCVGPAVGVSAGLWTQTVCLFLHQKRIENRLQRLAESPCLFRMAWGIVAAAVAYLAANEVLFYLSEQTSASGSIVFSNPPAWVRLLLAVPGGMVAWGLVLYASPACRAFYRFRRAA